MLTFFYELKYDVIKCCYKSFTNKEYFNLINLCKNKNIKIVVLHREDIFARALSLAVSRTLKKLNYKSPYGYKDVKVLKPYSVDVDIYQEEIMRYKNDYNSITSFLKSNKIKYYHITFNDCYIDSNRIENFKDLYLWLGLPNNIINNMKNNEVFLKLLNTDYNTKESNKFIDNIEEIKNINKNYDISFFN